MKGRSKRKEFSKKRDILVAAEDSGSGNISNILVKLDLFDQNRFARCLKISLDPDSFVEELKGQSNSEKSKFLKLHITVIFAKRQNG